MDNFLSKLNYLGGNLGLSIKIEEFVDLECVFLESTLYIEKDDRIKQTVINWLYRYGSLLSPSKIRRLTKSHDYDPHILSQLVSHLIEVKIVKPNWQILIEYKNEKNIKFKENYEKYLKRNDFILKNTPELRYRAEGRSQVIADILAYTQKRKIKSLYELAKIIHSPRNRVNESYRQLIKFGLIS